MTDLSLSLSPRQAIESLKRRRLLNAHEAVERLRSLSKSTQILQLFKHYFPRKYATSRKSKAAGDESWQAYSPLELEFMALVEQRMFPIASDLLADADERYYGIPVCAQAIDAEDLTHLRPALQVLIGLVGGVYAEVDWQTLLAQLAPECQPPLTSLDGQGEYEVDWEHFETACARMGGPMQHVGAALSVVTYSTGNPWLDYTEEMLSYQGFDFPWTVEAMDYLTAEWKKADALLKVFDKVLDWLEAPPPSRGQAGRMARLITAWNNGLRRKGSPAMEGAEDEEV